MTPSSVISGPTRVDAAGTTTMATDPFGRVTSLTPPGFGAFTTTYGADGKPMTAAAPNGNTTTSTYDALGRLTTAATGARASYGYGYNRAGSRLSEASTISGDPGNGTATLGYDALGRLTSYGLPGIRNQTNTWQEVANRDLLTVDGTPAVQAFDAANRPNTNGYAFDADGRLTARPGSAGFLEWDSLGRLVRVRVSQGGAVLATWTYDALDRLRTVERGGSRIRFRYAGTTAAVSGIVDDVGGSVLRQVVPGPDGTVLADRTGAGTDPRTYGTNGHHDVTWTADNSGAVTATLRYDPWGTLLRSSGTLPDWRFQGSWYDTSTGLAYARARWYSSALGSFVSEDTLLGAPETPASRHLLAYAQGDPVGGWDPEGRVIVGLDYSKSLASGRQDAGQSDCRRAGSVTGNGVRNQVVISAESCIPGGQSVWMGHLASRSLKYQGYSMTTTITVSVVAKVAAEAENQIFIFGVAKNEVFLSVALRDVTANRIVEEREFPSSHWSQVCAAYTDGLCLPIGGWGAPGVLSRRRLTSRFLASLWRDHRYTVWVVGYAAGRGAFAAHATTTLTITDVTDGKLTW